MVVYEAGCLRQPSRLKMGGDAGRAYIDSAGWEDGLTQKSVLSSMGWNGFWGTKRIKERSSGTENQHIIYSI